MEIKNIKYYKPDIDKTADMLRKVYTDAKNHRGGNVTFRALPKSDIEWNLDLIKYNYETDIDLYVTDLLEDTIKMMETRKEVDDNYYPIININMGIGDYSAFVVGDITFNTNTSWSKPCLENLEDYKKLPPIGTAPWYKKYMRILEEMLQRISGTGIAFCRGFFSPLDLAESLRGENIYMDFYDHPELMHEFLDYCADAIIYFADDIYGMVKKYSNDNKYATFYIDEMINMSEDIACMISGDLYREFCAPHTQKVIDHFGVGHMHCHSRAMYLVKEICSLNNVVNLWLATDPNQPKPIDHIEELVEDANGVCLAIDCERFEEISDNIDALRKGNFSICLPVEDIEEAKNLVERFQKL